MTSDLLFFASVFVLLMALTMLVRAVDYYVFGRAWEQHQQQQEETAQILPGYEQLGEDGRGFVRCGKCNRFCPQELVGEAGTDTPCIFCQNPVDALKGKGRYTEQVTGKGIRRQYSYDTLDPTSLNASARGSFVMR